MGLSRSQLKLWGMGFIGVGYFSVGVSAMAQPLQRSIAQTQLPEQATSPQPARFPGRTRFSFKSPRGRQGCYARKTEHPELFGDFRTIVLETAVIAANASQTADERGSALARLSQYYALLGEADKAIALSEEALNLVDDIESIQDKADVLMTIARMYGEQLGQPDRREDLVLQILALPDPIPNGPAAYARPIDDVIRMYINIGEYERLSEVVASVSPATQERLMSIVLYPIAWSSSIETRMQLQERFPILQSPARLDLVDPTNTPEDTWYSNLNDFRDTLLQAQQAGSVEQLVTSEVESLKEFDFFFQTYAYTLLGLQLVSLGEPERGVSLAVTALEQIEAVESTQGAHAQNSNDALSGNNAFDPNDSRFTYLKEQLVVVFILGGDFERAFALIDDLSVAAERPLRRVTLLLESSLYFDHRVRPDLTSQLLIEAERRAYLLENSTRGLLQVASRYREIGDINNA
ncbi:MAG: hypothetical protein AAFY33_15085, partial [Cyanobacteria bacterium J06643_4]